MLLSWTPVEGVEVYRLTIRAPDGTVLLASGELEEPSTPIDESTLQPDPLSVRALLEGRRVGGGEWAPMGPPALIPSGLGGGVPLRWEGATPISRVVVYDRTAVEVIFDEPVLGESLSLEVPREREANDLVLRARPWLDAGWGEGGEWAPLPLAVTLGERRDRQKPIDPGDPPALLLCFTVDTECSVLRQWNPHPGRVVDELVFGDFGDGAANGIGLHMSLLEHLGQRGCFFLDVLMEHRFGTGTIERVAAEVAARGHEVQLHVHPEHLLEAESTRAMAIGRAWSAREPDAFARVLEHSIALFERATGRAPVAYRAGGYRIVDEHFPVLREAGIKIDSSVNPHVNPGVKPWMLRRTQPFWVGGVLEAPPTWVLLQDDPERWEPRAFAPNPTLGDPVTRMRPEAGGEPLLATYVSHSFELLLTRRLEDARSLEMFERRLHAELPQEEAERLLALTGGRLRLHDGSLDEGAVAACAGVLRRIADRPDARTVTYAELADVAADFWPPGRDAERGDPIPALDRRSGAAGTVPASTYLPG